MSLPNRLRVMSAVSRAQISEDLKQWGALVRATSNVSELADAIGQEDIGIRRLERLRSWIQHFGFASPLPAPGYEPPDLAMLRASQTDAELADSVEFHDFGNSPPPDLADADIRPEITADLEHDDPDHVKINAKGQRLIMSVQDLIEVSKLDLNTWRIVRAKVNTWTTAMKARDADGNDEPVIVRNWQVSAWCERRYDREFRMPQISVATARDVPKIERPDGVELVLLIPDMHIGYRRLNRGQLYPLHDRRAIDVVFQAARMTQPDRIIILGDWADLAELSEKHPCPVEMIDTAEPALAEMRYVLATLRSCCPDARIDCLEGNHGDRLRRLREKYLRGLANVVVPGETEGALSLGKLIGCSEYAVNYVEPYGARLWLWDRVEVYHGDKVRSKSGQTVSSVIQDRAYSQIFGHIHRAELCYRTVWGPNGWRQIFVGSPGFLGRIDPGIIPSHTQQVNWQQAFGLLWYDHGTAQERMAIPLIHDGVAYVQGARIEGQDFTRDVREQIGWANMADDWLEQEIEV